jgi:hypothetical protein
MLKMFTKLLLLISDINLLLTEVKQLRRHKNTFYTYSPKMRPPSCAYIASKRSRLPVHKVSAWVRFTVQSVGRHVHEHRQEGQKSQAELDIDLAYHELSN